MYFNYDVMYGKNFEKSVQGVISSKAASFGIEKAFSILHRKYGSDSVIMIVFVEEEEKKKEEDTIEIEITFEDDEISPNLMWPAPSKCRPKSSNYCSWDNFETIYKLMRF